jgi:beta-ureidopropionase / N-carbamoyl-L-amino-acid hydrolase
MGSQTVTRPRWLLQPETAAGLRDALAIIADEPEEPVAMDEALQAHLARAAEAEAPGQWIRMPSGASHDAQLIARHVPACMLFVPSTGGVSHDFIEDTAEEHIVLGCQVAATAAATMLQDWWAKRS